MPPPAEPIPERPRLLAALDRFERPLIAFARSICGDPETARDAVQDTFLSLAKNPPDGDVESLAPWLVTVCRNRLTSLQRKTHRLVSMETLTLAETTDPSPGPADAAENRETSSQLIRLIATLPGFAQLLRGEAPPTLTWEMVRQLARSSKGSDPLGYRGEFLQLIDKAESLSR